MDCYVRCKSLPELLFFWKRNGLFRYFSLKKLLETPEKLKLSGVFLWKRQRGVVFLLENTRAREKYKRKALENKGLRVVKYGALTRQFEGKNGRFDGNKSKISARRAAEGF